MKRYLVFAGECYYANGGFNDAVDQFNNIEIAEKFAKSLMGKLIYPNRLSKYEWYQIADLNTFKIVLKGRYE